MSSESGTLWNGTTDTPTGVRFAHPIDIRYIEKSDFVNEYVVKHGLGITASDSEYTDGTLDDVLLRASTKINRKTGRYFNVQTIDETFSRYQLGTGGSREYVTLVLSQMPINTINRIDFEVLGQFISVDLTYLQDAYPESGFLQLVPNITSAAATSIPIPVSTQIGTYWVNYTFGYSTLPADIRQAVVLEAVKLIGLYRNPLGLSEFRSNQKTLKWDKDNRLDEQIAQLIAPYKKQALAAA